MLCAPWGQEYLRAHRAMRRLAVSLNAVGLDVLRFDYFGTGDSAGDTQDVNIKGCEQDIETAIEELQDMAGVERVGLVGLRLGATLAAHVALRRTKEVDRLLMWDPVSRGQDYLRELLDSNPPARARPASKGGGYEVQGFPLLASQADDISVVSLPLAAAGLADRSLILRSALPESPDAGFRSELIKSPSAWCEERDLGAGAVPAELIARIAGWAQE